MRLGTWEKVIAWTCLARNLERRLGGVEAEMPKFKDLLREIRRATIEAASRIRKP